MAFKERSLLKGEIGALNDQLGNFMKKEVQVLSHKIVGKLEIEALANYANLMDQFAIERLAYII